MNTTKINTPRSRGQNDYAFAATEVDELIGMLRESVSLEEQGDILQYLVDTKGLEYNTGDKIY